MESFKQLSKTKRFLFRLVNEKDSSIPIARLFNTFITILILLNVVSMILETVKEIYTPYQVYFKAFELFVIIVFTAEYIIRLTTADIDEEYKAKTRIGSILKYIFSFYGIIDLLAILPYYLPFTRLDMRIVRTLRLLRFLRLFKIARYNDSLNLITSVIREKKSEIGVTCSVIIIVMIIASFMMYYCEYDPESQTNTFPNVLTCIWWSIVTLTTVGYGDVYPITGMGKLIGGLIAFLGIGLVALPTGIISAGFLEKVDEKKEKQKADNQNNKDKEKTDQDNLVGPKRICPCCGREY